MRLAAPGTDEFRGEVAMEALEEAGEGPLDCGGEKWSLPFS
jgi:hypothetical protein